MVEVDPALLRLKQRYLEAVLTGVGTLAGLTIDEGLRQGFSIFDIYLGILVPTQDELGHAWFGGKVNVAQEHLGTQITLDQMNRLRFQISPRSKLGFRVAVTTVEGDSHFVGARMVADFFLADGWDVDFLGAETPGSDLVELVRRRSVDLVAISVTSEDCLLRLEWTVASLANLPHRPKVLVGGHVLLDRPEIAMDLGADGVGMNLSEAVLEGRRLIGIPTEPASLSDHLRVLGRRVQEIRRELGWNQQQLANAAGLDRTYISAVEHGNQNLTLGAVVKVADALGVELVRLLIQSGPHDFRAKPK